MKLTTKGTIRPDKVARAVQIELRKMTADRDRLASLLREAKAELEQLRATRFNVARLSALESRLREAEAENQQLRFDKGAMANAQESLHSYWKAAETRIAQLERVREAAQRERDCHAERTGRGDYVCRHAYPVAGAKIQELTCPELLDAALAVVEETK